MNHLKTSQEVKDILMNGTKDIPVDLAGVTREGVCRENFSF